MPGWLAGLIAGVFVAVITQWLQAIFRRGQYIHENLVERYCELMDIATQELERARTFLAEIDLSDRESDRDENFSKHMAALDQKRHELRRQLFKLSFQIRLMEPDPRLCQQVTRLAESQPFQYSLFPPRRGEGNYDERERLFRKQIGDFESMMNNLARMVMEKHAKKELQLHDL